MDYWKGYMNWPVAQGWVCETCEKDYGMTWGLANGRCRCDRCHTQYIMRDGDKVVDTPISLLKDEYKEPARKGWKMYARPLDEWTDDEWDEAFK